MPQQIGKVPHSTNFDGNPVNQELKKILGKTSGLSATTGNSLNEPLNPEVINRGQEFPLAAFCNLQSAAIRTDSERTRNLSPTMHRILCTR